MSKNRLVVPEKLKPWIEARERYKLSHVQVQMARELGMNPRKFGSLANHKQERWKSPLPEFIEQCYERQFGRCAPEDSRSIEQKLKAARGKKEATRLPKAQTESTDHKGDATLFDSKA
ncbi:MAG: hypothetical protein WC091_25375 [Sulfuricellaceae bacterium]